VSRAFGVGFQLGAKLGDDDAEILDVVAMNRPPNLGQGQMVRHDLVRIGCEERKEVELLGRQA
jgi:hypothetical protein